MAKILGPAAPFPELALAPAPASAGTEAEAEADADAGADGGLEKPPPASAEKGDVKKPGVASTSKDDTNTPPAGRLQKAASTAADAQKTATPTTPPEAPTLPVPAPTSTITRGDGIISTAAAQKCTPRRTVSSAEATSAASEKKAVSAVAAAPKESEPMYRVEEVASPSADPGHGGGGRERKRAFVVTIELPGLTGGNTEGSEGAMSADSSSSSGDGKRRTGKAKGPSLSDFELDVLPEVLQLRIPRKYRLRLEMPCVVDDENVSAKFNKSRAVLKVSMQEK